MAKLTALSTLEKLLPTVSVGALSANLLEMGKGIALLEEAGVGMLHFDVMDGCFCPELTAGARFIRAVKTKMLKDVHLMIADPLPKLADYVKAGADVITLHAESSPHLSSAFLQLEKAQNANDPDRGIVRGLALNPGTAVECVEPLLSCVEMVKLLAVNPGFPGQVFSPEMPRKLERLRGLIAKTGRRILVCIDGGVTRENFRQVAALGSDVVVTGSAVFEGGKPRETFEEMIGALRGKT